MRSGIGTRILCKHPLFCHMLLLLQGCLCCSVLFLQVCIWQILKFLALHVFPPELGMGGCGRSVGKSTPINEK